MEALKPKQWMCQKLASVVSANIMFNTTKPADLDQVVATSDTETNE